MIMTVLPSRVASEVDSVAGLEVVHQPTRALAVSARVYDAVLGQGLVRRARCIVAIMSISIITVSIIIFPMGW